VEKHKARRRKMENLLGPWYQGREEERLNRRQSTTTTSFILPSADIKKALDISYLVWQSVSNSRHPPLNRKICSFPLHHLTGPKTIVWFYRCD
jgi:hypothetical protein